MSLVDEVGYVGMGKDGDWRESWSVEVSDLGGKVLLSEVDQRYYLLLLLIVSLAL